jgi:hypothetical protein
MLAREADFPRHIYSLRGGPKFFWIIAALNQTADAFHDKRTVFAIGYAKPCVACAEDFATLLARSHEIIDDQWNIKL